MKKVVMLASAFVLIAGLTFAQTPQTQDKAAKPAEKKEMKDEKGCDNKTKASCAHSKTSKGCCASDKKAAAPEKSPEKK
jgi:hypothetical protein